MKPDYEEYSALSAMGPKLRSLIETHLTEDLRHYGIDQETVKFDWSESCSEGSFCFYLDGMLENFSSIGVYNIKDEPIAGGWMEYILHGDFFIAYWEFVRTNGVDKATSSKEEIGIPDHVWQQIPEEIKPVYVMQRYKKRYLP